MHKFSPQIICEKEMLYLKKREKNSERRTFLTIPFDVTSKLTLNQNLRFLPNNLIIVIPMILKNFILFIMIFVCHYFT